MVTNICALVQYDCGGTNGTLHTCVAWKCRVIWDTCQRRDCCMHTCCEVKRTWDESAAWGTLVAWLERRMNRPQHLDEHKSMVSPTGADLSTDTIDLGLGLGSCDEVLLHNTSCNRCNRSRGLFVRVDEENERCSISWSSHTSSQAHSSVWCASELLCLTAVFGTCNAKTCNKNDTVVKLHKNDVLR